MITRRRVKRIHIYILDLLRLVNREGSYQGETKCSPCTSKNSDTHSTVENWRNFGKMKLTEPARQKVGREELEPYKQAHLAKRYSDLLQGLYNQIKPKK